ncbi:MAG: cupin domain-containing protein [Calditrichia bacterium]
MKEITLNYDKIEWKDAPEYQEGTQIKMLREEGKKKTFFIKLPKGFRGAPHIFTVNEQHIILEGSYKDEGILYEAGTYRFIPVGNAHDGTISEEGALILVIQEPA